MRASGGASAAQDPGDADRNGVLELGKHGCKPAQVIAARHGATKSTAKGTKEEGNRCCETGSARAKPLGRRSGKPPRAAMTGAQEGQDSQSQENGLGPERAKKTQERAREKQRPESQVEGKGPAGGLMSMSKIAGRSVTGQQVRICRALRLHISSVMLECNL